MSRTIRLYSIPIEKIERNAAGEVMSTVLLVCEHVLPPESAQISNANEMKAAHAEYRARVEATGRPARVGAGDGFSNRARKFAGFDKLCRALGETTVNGGQVTVTA